MSGVWVFMLPEGFFSGGDERDDDRRAPLLRDPHRGTAGPVKDKSLQEIAGLDLVQSRVHQDRSASVLSGGQIRALADGGLQRHRGPLHECHLLSATASDSLPLSYAEKQYVQYVQ